MNTIVEYDTVSVLPLCGHVLPPKPAVSQRDTALQVSHVVAGKKPDTSSVGVMLSSPLPDRRMADTASLERLLESGRQDIRQLGVMLVGLNVSRFTSPDTFAVEFSAAMDSLSSVQKKNQLQEIERARQQNLQTMALNVEKINEALEAAKEAQKSGLAAKIFGWISAIASIVVGALMVATGVCAAVGALMIAGGVMGVANLAVQEMAKAGLISPKVMEVLGPILTAIEIALAVAAAVVTFGGAAAGVVAKMAGKMAEIAARMGSKVVQMAAKIVSETIASLGGKLAGLAGNVVGKASLHGVKFGVQIGETALNVGTGVTQSTASGFSAKAEDANADVKASRAEMAAVEMLLDRIREVLRQITEAASVTMQQILQMMHAQDASLQNVSSRPATI